jgi:hypothetical protein
MAKVKIQGHASGTGILTVTAPNTSTDRTITLPDATGTLLTADGDGSSLTGVGVDGISSSADATAITIDANENVGIGVTPESWISTYPVLQIGSNLSLIARTNEDTAALSNNAYADSVNTRWEYIGANGTSEAAIYQMNNDGDHEFRTAPSGAADAEITWTTRLAIMNDGRGLSQFTAEAWANINGTGTPSLQDSHNVSSVTDVATGRYQLNWGTAIGNTAYSSYCSTAPGYIAGATNRGSASLEVQNGDSNWSLVDLAQVCCVIFGD